MFAHGSRDGYLRQQLNITLLKNDGLRLDSREFRPMRPYISSSQRWSPVKVRSSNIPPSNGEVSLLHLRNIMLVARQKPDAKS